MNSTSYNITNEDLEALKRKIDTCFREVNVTHSTIEEPEGFNFTGKWCKKIFDSLLCWDPTPAGAVAVQNCPDQYGWNPNKLVRKMCTIGARWAVHPETDKSWTNYSSCVDFEDLTFRKAIIALNIAGYSISLFFLIIAMGIFYFFNLTHCSRTKVHMQLFIAFALNCISWLTYYTFLIQNVEVLMENTVTCQIFSLINMYFTSTCYMWMFTESWHLYMSVVVVFVDQTFEMRTFVLIGWGAPLILVIAYALIRVYLGDTKRCMIDYSPAVYVFSVPTVVTILCSLYFLVRILKVLISKSRLNRSRAQVISSTTRAAVILSPLFGLQYLFMPVHPPIGTLEERFYAVFTGVLTSFQGMVLVFLFCFTNKEVLTQVRTEYERRKRLKQEIMELQMTAATAGDSVNIQEQAV